MFEYKLLPVPAPAKKAKGRKTIDARMAHALTEVMNAQARENWEYVGQERFGVEEKSGLMGKERHVECRYMIFRRELGLSEMPLEQKLEQIAARKAETRVPPAPTPPAAPFPEPQPPAPEGASPPEEAESSAASPPEVEPTRVFSPFPEPEDPSSTAAPALGPAKKS